MSCSAIAFSMIVLRISFTFEPGLEDPGNEAPHRPRKEADEQSGRNEEPSGPAVEDQGPPGRHQRSCDDLAFSPNVDHVRPKGDANAQPHQEERGCLDEGLGEPEAGAQRAAQHGAVGGQRIGSEDHEEHGAEEERKEDADKG